MTDAEKNALVESLTRNADRHRTPCRCACGCTVLLTMPSEWMRGTCIFCGYRECSQTPKAK